MSSRFDVCTGFTIGQVSCNCFEHSGPLVIPANKFIGGCMSRVSSRKMIMMGMDYLPMQVLVIRNIQEAIHIQQIIFQDAFSQGNRSSIFAG